MKRKLNLYFFASNKDINKGSYRIWVHDFIYNLRKIGHKAKEFNNLGELIKSDFSSDSILFVAKDDCYQLNEIRKKFCGFLGAINPTNEQSTIADFSIVGSIEEKLSLDNNKPIFIYPLIENFLSNKELVFHKNKEFLTLGYHGNLQHLYRMTQGLNQAIETYGIENKIQLNLIIPKETNLKSIILPKNCSIEIIGWDINTFESELRKIDIGLVPNITNNKNFFRTKSIKKGLYDTDFHIRFKNKSNAGRTFVFIQMGIPVICDMTPSNFHLFGDGQAGFIAFDKSSWLNSIKRLANSEIRNFIAKTAYKRFTSNYNIINYVIRIIEGIEKEIINVR